MLKRVSMVGRCSLAGLLAFGLAAESRATISYSGGTYSQNFDTLATSGTANAWVNDSTLPGWSLFQYTGGGISTYSGGTGASSAGNFYSFGTGTPAERALGGLGSGNTYFGSPAPATGALAGYIALALKNTNGSTLNSFTLAFAGEQWRDGGNTTAQTMALQYGFGSTFAGVGSWSSPGGTFDYASPVNTSTAAAVDGNVAGKVNGLGGTVSSLSWLNNETLWIRWIEKNDVGNDHGLAIDDLTFSATAVPEASTWIAGLGLTLGMLGSFVRKYRK